MRKNNLISTADLARELGCSKEFLLKQRKEGLFKEGVHYRNINPWAARPSYRWSLTKVLEKISEKPY